MSGALAGLQWVDEFLPRISADGWNLIEIRADGACYRRGSMTVIVSGSTELDGKRWLHVSCARPDRLPKWEELREVKNRFVGEERLALQVLPQKSRYVNLHPHCLHLWHCIDGDPIPDFAHGGGTI